MNIADPFVDVSPSQNTFEATNSLRQDGWIVGRSRNPSMFYPNSAMTRAEISVLIVRAQYGTDVSLPDPDGAVPDVDVNYWGAGWIEYAVNSDLMDLFPDGNFYPRQPATRADVAELLWLALS